MEFTCKVCGGELVRQGNGLAICSSCDTLQTVSGLEDSQRAYLLDRAAYLRRQGRFSQASDTIDRLLTADLNDAEAYWQAVLCRFGVSFEPTGHGTYHISCQRMRQGNVLTSEDYKRALKLATPEAAAQYQRDAQLIAAMQQECEAVMARLKPFDVAIVSGASPASQAAAEALHAQLTQQQLNVYLAPLAEKAFPADAPEAVNYAAVHTAWAMVVLVSSMEEARDAALINQWTTYRSLDAKRRPRQLILGYQGVDLYDLPEELSSLEAAQQLEGHGALMDLAYGVVRYRPAQKTKQTPVHEEYLRKAYEYLKAREFNLAQDYARAALDANKNHFPAMICAFLAGENVAAADETGLLQLPRPLRATAGLNDFFKRLPATHAFAARIAELEEQLNDRLYREAMAKAGPHADQAALEDVRRRLEDLRAFRDAPQQLAAVEQRINGIIRQREEAENNARLQKLYDEAALLERRDQRDDDSAYYLAKAKEAFAALGGFSDSAQRAADLARRINERKANAPRRRKARKARRTRRLIVGLAGSLAIAALYVYGCVLCNVSPSPLVPLLDGLHNLAPMGVFLVPVLLLVTALISGAFAQLVENATSDTASAALVVIHILFQVVMQIMLVVMLHEHLPWMYPESGLVSLLLIAGTALVSFVVFFLGAAITDRKSN